MKVILFGLATYAALIWFLTLLFPRNSIKIVLAPPQPDCPKCRKRFMCYEPMGTSHLFACPACRWIDRTR